MDVNQLIERVGRMKHPVLIHGKKGATPKELNGIAEKLATATGRPELLGLPIHFNEHLEEGSCYFIDSALLNSLGRSLIGLAMTFRRPTYWYIVRYDDGRKADAYQLGPQFDIEPMYDARAREGKTEPIGTAWGTSSEIWITTLNFSFRLMPPSEPPAETQRLMEIGLRGAVPMSEQDWRHYHQEKGHG